MAKVKDNDNRPVGIFTIEVIRDGPSGPVVLNKQKVYNRVLNTGKKQTWRMAAGLSTNIWDQMRIGTSGATTDVTQTNLLAPVGNTGSLTTVDSLTMDGRTLQVVCSYPSGAGTISSAGIEEVCVLNANTSPGGSALCRALFTAVNKTRSDKLKITYEVRIT
jgi:hypothetical protein